LVRKITAGGMRKCAHAEALKMLEQEYGTHIPTRHPHFIMGTMKLHPPNFILIGVLRTGLDPEELAKQGSLF
jgi:hypothetical protein